MCHKYWPDSGTQMYGAFEVTMLPVKDYPDYTLREFKIVDSRVCLLYIYHSYVYPSVQHSIHSSIYLSILGC